MWYGQFLCMEGYNSTFIGLIMGGPPIDCFSIKPALGSDGLNLPSIQYMVAGPNARVTATFVRTVTNVGQPR
ncbi:hypothetical protein QJS04_geneDACA008445 [Acorus gramineus]|uniref:Subtilisin-like protease fibronectin type-III domain-containing protein n=1 Tax=Acorus gramineus TaxID=55184 RepID=A0AAV9AJP0_ACOGR|nr:hypothetical protein QJS04_geneDACA008445 [Acorus gramineus]